MCLGHCQRPFDPAGKSSPTRLLGFSPDSRWLATADLLSGKGAFQPQVSVWDLAARERRLHITGLYHPPIIRVDGVDVSRRERLQNTGLSQPVAADFSSGSRLFVIGYADGTAQLWDMDEGALLFQWKAHLQALSHLAFTPDGESIASCDGLSPSIQFLHLPTLRRQLAEVGLDW
jgi:WD40 repeat protein